MIYDIINIVHSRGMFFLCLNLYIVLYVSDQWNWIKNYWKTNKKLYRMAKAHFWLTFDFRNWLTPYIIFLYWRENYNWVEHLLCRSFLYANYSVTQCNIFLGVSMSTKASDGERSYIIMLSTFTKQIQLVVRWKLRQFCIFFWYITGILSVKWLSFVGTTLVLNVTNRDKIERLLPSLSNNRCNFLPRVDVMFCALKGRISYSWRNYQHLYIFLLLQVLIHCKVEFHKENWRHFSIFCLNLIILKGHPVTQAQSSCIRC